MKRLLLITLLAVAVFAGCETDDTDSDRDRRTEEASDDRPGAGAQAADLSDDLEDDAPAVDDLDAETVEMLFLTVLRDQEPVFENIPDNLVLDTAHATCDALDAGVTFEQVAATGMAEGSFSTAEIGAMTGAAVAAFCPEYEDEMQDFADRWS